MLGWISALTAVCIARQNNKSNLKLFIEVPLDEWQGDLAHFCATHIGHKGSLYPRINQHTPRLVVVGSFSRFLMVYPVTNTGAQATTVAFEKVFLHFGSPQSIIYDRGTAFFNTDFVNWTEEIGITLRHLRLMTK